MKPNGLSVFEFYDTASRILSDESFLKYLKTIIYGRVSLSAIKFTSFWITPGRCSELPIKLKKIFGQNILLLSLL